MNAPVNRGIRLMSKCLPWVIQLTSKLGNTKPFRNITLMTKLNIYSPSLCLTLVQLFNDVQSCFKTSTPSF